MPVVTALRRVVLSDLCGTGLASDRTEMTAVLSVLAGSVRHVCPCQSRCTWRGLCNTSGVTSSLNTAVKAERFFFKQVSRILNVKLTRNDKANLT